MSLLDMLNQPAPERKGMRPEVAAALMGLGQGLGQLGSGQPVNMSGALQMAGGKGSDLDRIMRDPRLRGALTKMPPQMAERILMRAAFGVDISQPKPVMGVEVGGNLINPVTGEMIYQGQPQPDYQFQKGIGVVDMNNPSPELMAGAYQPPAKEPDHPTSYEEFILANPGGTPEQYNQFLLDRENRRGGLGPMVGNIPAGHTVIEDPSVPGGFRAVPIPGTPAAREAEEARLAAEKTTDMAASASETKQRSANIVLSALDDAETLVRGAGVLDPAVGFGTGITENIRGSTAANYLEIIKPIEASIGFDRLQQMRDESPTGGALGQVSERELALLAGSIRSLGNTQDPERVLANIQTIRDIYSEIMRKASAYPNAAKYGFDQPNISNASGGIGRHASFEAFAAAPGMKAAADNAGTTLEAMWEIYQADRSK